MVNRSFFLFLAVLLASCTGAVQMLPEPSPTPTRTVSFRPTSTPLRTRTPVTPEATKPAKPEMPTSTPTPTQIDDTMSMILLGASQSVTEGRFSFRPIIGFKKKVSNREAVLTSRDGGVLISLTAIPVHNVGRLEPVLEKLLRKMAETIQELDASSPYPVEIDGGPGLAVDLRGKIRGEAVAGRLALVTPSSELLFYALAISVEGSDGQSWESRGQAAYNSVIRWIDFLEPPK